MATKGLVDLDMLVYESCFAAQARLRYMAEEKNEEYDPEVIAPFEFVMTYLDRVLEELLYHAEVDELMGFLSSDTNFRYEIDPSYKSTRAPSPFHKNGARAYLRAKVPTVSVEGFEADDLMCLYYNPGDTIISRDKDLRMMPARHYSWESFNAPAFGPVEFDYIGKIWLDKKRKLKGGGVKFFYSQLIMGDKADDIEGIPRKGDVWCFNNLADLETEEELYEAVREVYFATYGEEEGEEIMRQRGQLLWMVRDVNEDFSPKLWEYPNDYQTKTSEHRAVDGSPLSLFRDQCFKESYLKMGSERGSKEEGKGRVRSV